MADRAEEFIKVLKALTAHSDLGIDKFEAPGHSDTHILCGLNRVCVCVCDGTTGFCRDFAGAGRDEKYRDDFTDSPSTCCLVTLHGNLLRPIDPNQRLLTSEVMV